MEITPDLILQRYASQRGNVGWDLIVIGASDGLQSQGYLELGKRKFGDKLRVYSDTPGRKIGNGGALLLALDNLHREFSDLMFTKKILYIPAGGYSQRMPWVSALGKLFTLMPTKYGVFDMLDMTVAFSLPFLDASKPGCLFLGAPDLLLPFKALQSDLRCGRDFTALAHVTEDLQTATGHGVYIADKLDSGEWKCRRVLQKPSMDDIVKHKALLPEHIFNSSNSGNNDAGTAGNRLTKPKILIDSDFWLGPRVAQVLLKWLERTEVKWELDAYGDFLRALGDEAVLDYAANTTNLSCKDQVNLEELKADRISLFNTFQREACQLNLCVLAESEFIHIGSTREYLNHLFAPKLLGRDFSPQGLQSSKGLFESRVLVRGLEWPQTVCSETTSLVIRSDISVGKELEIGDRSLLEYCTFTADVVKVGAGCVLSNCCYGPVDDTAVACSSCRDVNSTSVSQSSSLIEVADGTLIQTVPLLSGGFVTWFLQSIDDTKRRADTTELTFFGASLHNFYQRHKLNSTADGSVHSLWCVQLFPYDARLSASESFALSLAALRGAACLGDWLHDESGHRKLMSMAEILSDKDVHSFIANRQQSEEKMQ